MHFFCTYWLGRSKVKFHGKRTKSGSTNCFMLNFVNSGEMVSDLLTLIC